MGHVPSRDRQALKKGRAYVFIGGVGKSYVAFAKTWVHSIAASENRLGGGAPVSSRRHGERNTTTLDTRPSVNPPASKRHNIAYLSIECPRCVQDTAAADR
jgi:hypothetical protein